MNVLPDPNGHHDTADTIPAPPVIEAGHAQETVKEAIRKVMRALEDLEAVCMGAARGLDAVRPSKAAGLRHVGREGVLARGALRGRRPLDPQGVLA